MKGTFYDFKTDGSYDSDLSKDPVDGKWTFGKDNKSIILIADKGRDGNNVWDIISINDKELVLTHLKDNDGLSFRFTAVK